MTYDAIVVGAGPAGSTAARLLAREGASVLLLERHHFPRDKPCGGAVTLRAAAAQDLNLSPVIERTVYGARFTLRLGPSFERRFGEPLNYMTRRCRLDAFLAQAAVEAGANLHDGEPVRAVEAADEGVVIRTGAGSYRGRLLIGADGANGVVGRAAGICPRFEEAVALEGNIVFSADIPAEWREVMGFDLGGLAGGYGWVFPKGDHLSVGVGAWKYAAFTLRPKLAELCRRYGFAPEAMTGLHGHRLPMWLPGSLIARGPVALAGDAAGLLDPFSGEGIHMAFASARLAARTALRCLAGQEPDLSAYQRAVEQQLQPELVVSRQLQELFHLAPPLYVALMRRSDRLWGFFCRLLRGETTYGDLMRAIGPLRLAVGFFAGWVQRWRLSRVAALRRGVP